jgi:hypothetical protein
MEYRLTGVSRKAPNVRKFGDTLELGANLRSTHAEDRTVEKDISRALSVRGEKPVPTSSRLATRPRTRISPVVGAVMRLMI